MPFLPKDLFSDRAFYAKLWRLSAPIALQSLMLSLVAAADALMLGRSSQDAMAAVSLATQIPFVQSMFIWAIASGVSMLGAQYWGKRDLAAIDDIFGICVRQTSIVAILFFLPCLLWPEAAMRLFTHDAHLVQIGAGYLRIASWSYLLVGLAQSYQSVMKISDRPSHVAWISSTAVLLNILLNLVFIFGLFGLPAMGAKGAALATVIARVVETALGIGLSFRVGFIPLKIRCIYHFNHLLNRDYLKCTLPIWGSATLWGIGFTAFTAILGHLGRDAAAANAVQAVVRDILCCFCNGVAIGGSIMVGNELGAGRLDLGRKFGARMTALSWLVGLGCTLVVLALIPLLLHTVKLSPGAQNYLVGMLAIMAFYMIGRCVNTVVINGVFAAGGDTLFDFYSLIPMMWGLAIPCALAAAFWLKLSPLLVFACTCLDEVGKLPWVMHHYFKYKWVKDLTR